jgi:starch synthase
MHVLMVAAENGALPGGKVGGMGDVLRDVPRSLAARGHTVSVLTPAYGSLHRTTRARRRGEVVVAFAGRSQAVEVFALPPSGPGKRLRPYLLEHADFAACGAGAIYCNDPPGRPFETDSGKFALFCAAAAELLADDRLGRPHIIHLHDWHAASLAVLLRLHPRYAALRNSHLVLTVHNLAMQGIRPWRGHEASPASWYPDLPVDERLLDPRYPDCYNPMRAGIALADRVHVVSPTYAKEICTVGSSLGEGLQADLAAARADGRLLGILNGCEYPPREAPAPAWSELLGIARQQLLRWTADERNVRATHLLALERLRAQPAERGTGLLLTAVGRLTDQKLGILADTMADGRSVLEHLLDQLHADDRLWVLGSGDPALEEMLTRVQSVDRRLLFFCGYSEALSDALYASGDLFLMPSRFEPCGIAQMLAMRRGQPCLVARTGGLADTVTDGVDGFSFDPGAPGGAAPALLERLASALALLRENGREAAAMRAAARAARFPWETAVEAYEADLYDVNHA